MLKIQIINKKIQVNFTVYHHINYRYTVSSSTMQAFQAVIMQVANVVHIGILLSRKTMVLCRRVYQLELKNNNK